MSFHLRDDRQASDDTPTHVSSCEVGEKAVINMTDKNGCCITHWCKKIEKREIILYITVIKSCKIIFYQVSLKEQYKSDNKREECAL